MSFQDTGWDRPPLDPGFQISPPADFRNPDPGIEMDVPPGTEIAQDPGINQYPGQQPSPGGQGPAPVPAPGTPPAPGAAPAQDVNGLIDKLRGGYNPDAWPEDQPVPRLPTTPPGTPMWPPPYRRAPYPTYYPSMANRPPSEWGSDHFTLTGGMRYPGVAPGPFMPQPWELPGIYQNLGMQLSRWGSGYVGPFAGRMSAYSSSYMKGFMQGQAMRARLLHEQLKINAIETAQRQGQELEEYGSLFAEYGTDPAKQDQLRQALEDTANQFQDRHMLNALAQGGVQAAQRLLQWRDAKHSDLKKSNAQLQKDERNRELDAPHMRTPTDDAGTPIPQAPEEPAPEEEGAPTTHPGTNEPLPEEGPGLETPDGGPQAEGDQPQRMQLAMAGDQLPVREAQLQSPIPERRAPQQQQSQTLQRAYNEGYKPGDVNSDAQSAFEHGGIRASDAKGMSPKYRAFVDARRIEIGNELNDILRSNMRGNQVYDAVNQRIPGFGNQIKGYVEGRYPLPRTSAQRNPMLQWIQKLGEKADPSFTANTFTQRNNMVKQFTQGQDGRLLTGIATANDHIGFAREKIETLRQQGQFGGGGILPGGYQGSWLNSAYQAYISGAPDWAPGANPVGRQAVLDLENTINLIAPEIARAQKGAAPTVSEINHQREKLSAARSPDDLLKMLDSAQHLFIQRGKELSNRFQAGMGRDPARGIQGLMDDFEKKGRNFDPATGDAPGGYLPGVRHDTLGGAWRRLLQTPDPGDPTLGPTGPVGPSGSPSGGLAPGWRRIQ
jgi:hypothetical protein